MVYKKKAYDALKATYRQIECVLSPQYAETNSMYTLGNCREAIGNDDFILLESDIIYSKNAISELQENEHPDIMLITSVKKFQDQYYVAYDENRTLMRCSTNKAENDAKGKLVGIHKLSSSFYHRICEEYEKIVADKPKLGYEYQLLWMSQNVCSLYVLNTSDVAWYEIDDEDDLKYAEENIVSLL